MRRQKWYQIGGALILSVLCCGCSTSYFPFGQRRSQKKLAEELALQQKQARQLETELARADAQLAQAEKELARLHDGADKTEPPRGRQFGRRGSGQGRAEEDSVGPDPTDPGDWKKRDPSSQTLQAFASRHPGFLYNRQTNIARLETELLFSPGQTHLSSRAEEVLSDQVNTLQAATQRGFLVMVAGHGEDASDPPSASQGSSKDPSDAWTIAGQRAANVAAFLKAAGVSAESMATVAAADSRVTKTATIGFSGRLTSPSERRNRRVEIYLLDRNDALAKWRERSSQPSRR